LTFLDAQGRLLAYVRDRIQNGELTERGLARLIGISQPHAHNVLKGARRFSPEVIDAILKYFQISLLDLASSEDLEASLRRKSVPERVAEVGVLDLPIGPGRPWPETASARRRYPLPFPALLAPSELVMAPIFRDPEMCVTLGDSDIALLDISEARRLELAPDGLYVVVRCGQAVLRYVRPGAHCHYLLTDVTMNRPPEWERLNIGRAELLEVVKARVRWLGRTRDRDLPMHQRGRFLYEATSW